ncbi:MAG: hypothetical protein ACREJ6_14335 [Candidatus Methylomirabilis sp.]
MRPADVVQPAQFQDWLHWYPRDPKDTERVLGYDFKGEDVDVTIQVENRFEMALWMQVYQVGPVPPGGRDAVLEPKTRRKVKEFNTSTYPLRMGGPMRLSFFNTKALGEKQKMAVQVLITAVVRDDSEVRELAKGVTVAKTSTRHVIFLGGSLDGEANLTIDLKTGAVSTRLSLDEATRLFWETVSEFAKASLGEGRRCSCDCDCNRKLATQEIYEKECIACQSGLHLKEKEGKN